MSYYYCVNDRQQNLLLSNTHKFLYYKNHSVVNNTSDIHIITLVLSLMFSILLLVAMKSSFNAAGIDQVNSSMYKVNIRL